MDESTEKNAQFPPLKKKLAMPQCPKCGEREEIRPNRLVLLRRRDYHCLSCGAWWKVEL